MTKHLILGQGNLGMSLLHAMPRMESALLGPGWKFPQDGMEPIFDLRPDVVWCAVGGGSVDWVIRYPQAAWNAIVELPVALARYLPATTKLICFSSDYCASERVTSSPAHSVAVPRSGYANLKRMMEDLVIQARPENARVIRVGSLYGPSLPEKTLAGKLAKRYPQPCQLSLPTNLITPTSTDWVAEHCVRHFDELFDSDLSRHHLAPRGFIAIADYGRYILGSNYQVTDDKPNMDRPQFSNLGSSFGRRSMNFMEALTLYPPIERKTP